MECVITEAALHRAQQEQSQTEAAVPGTTSGDPGEHTQAHSYFKNISAAAAASYQTETEASIIR